jgi:hypothetical protein
MAEKGYLITRRLDADVGSATSSPWNLRNTYAELRVKIVTSCWQFALLTVVEIRQHRGALTLPRWFQKCDNLVLGRC